MRFWLWVYFVLQVCSQPNTQFLMSNYFQGVSYDHVELNFFLNGKSLQCPVTGIRGTVFPVFYGQFLCMALSQHNSRAHFHLSPYQAFPSSWRVSQNNRELPIYSRTDARMALIFCTILFVVDDGAILDVQFTDFSYPPPDGYDRIMFEQNLLQIIVCFLS